MIKNRKSFISYKPINLYLKGLRHKHTKTGIYTYYLFIIYCVLVNIIIIFLVDVMFLSVLTVFLCY